MRYIFASICFLPALLLACQSSNHAAQSEPSALAGQYIVSGTVVNPGSRPLTPGVNVAWVLAHTNVIPHGQVNLVLIRHCPEGKTRELIPLDVAGKLMDEKQNYVLRDGDELMFSASPAQQ